MFNWTFNKAPNDQSFLSGTLGGFSGLHFLTKHGNAKSANRCVVDAFCLSFRRSTMCISSPCATPLAPKKPNVCTCSEHCTVDSNQPISHAALKELLKTWKDQRSCGCGLFGHLTAVTAGNNSYQPHNLFESLHAHMNIERFLGFQTTKDANPKQQRISGSLAVPLHRPFVETEFCADCSASIKVL